MMIIKVARDEDLTQQVGRDIYFDLVDHDKVPQFQFQKQTPFTAFKEEVAKEFGVPVEFQRFWFWANRQNNTYRPSGPLMPQEEAQSVGQLWEASNETNNAELKLFLEVELGPDSLPIQPPEKTKEDLLLFFKFYNPESGELRYAGRLFVKCSGRPIDILEKLNKMVGFGPNEEIELYEEIKFEPSVMCVHLDKRTTFRLSEIENGDIICFQKAPQLGSEESCQYPDVPSFLEYVHNRQQEGMDPKWTEFTWRIDNYFSKLNKERCSDSFKVGGYKWRTELELEEGKLSIYLKVADCETLPDGWSVDAGFSVTVVDQINGKNEIIGWEKDLDLYNAEDRSCGYDSIILLSELNDPDRGYIVNDTLVLEVRVFVHNARAVLDEDTVVETDLSGPSSNNRAVLSQVVHQIINQDTENFFDKMALSLLEKLQDDNAPHSFRIADFKGIPSDNYVDVGIFMVPTSLESYAKELLARHANIGTGNAPVHYVNEMVFAVLCDAVKSMDTMCFSEMTESWILKWRDAIRGALQFGFKVDFLKGHLKSIAERYLAKFEQDSFERKKLQAIDEKISAKRKKVQALDEKVSAKRKKLYTLNLERADMYNKMNTEIRKTCEVAASKYTGDSYGNIFN
ncbi:hypothetical protein ACFE04_020691 [Oxalis oulophora]